ncbi:Cell death activator CIDE-B [Triplophysa tibetana]|uniref:Cell death activator CIDE-B n=1 Tax=Triplophysa tibetana TaxID=1572043 RepID=A0A5A9PQU3_9TELE|nr:Cell death activator CIDE-B [Triplophysa tibetana]
METTSSFLKSVSKRVWAAPQRPFRVCSWNRETKKWVTAGTLEELKERAAQALLMSTLLTLVCEEDGTELDSDEFFMALPDNTVFMGLKPGESWKPHPLNQRDGHKPRDNKPRAGKDIAQVTFDLYKKSPKDVFGSLNVKATYQGLYSVSADFQCLGPKKFLREALKLLSTLLNTAGYLLISTAKVIRRVIQGADFLEAQQSKAVANTEYWH